MAIGLRADPVDGAPSVPDDLREASIAIGYDPRGRCPDLMLADPQDGTAALVLFLVGSTGVPSRASIKSSSGSQSLDAASLGCVMKLRFHPAVRAGEGNPVDSWQVIAWKWGRGHAEAGGTAPAAAAASPAAPPATMAAAGAAPGAHAAVAGGALAGAASAGSAAARGAAAGPAAGSRPAGPAEVRVCVDPAGQLAHEPVITHTSGDPGLDAAAVRIARSGAPYYRPAAATPVSGCVELAIRFEQP